MPYDNNKLFKTLGDRASASMLGKGVIGLAGGILLFIAWSFRQCTSNFNNDFNEQIALKANKTDTTYTEYNDANRARYEYRYLGTIYNATDTYKVLTNQKDDRGRKKNLIKLFTTQNKYVGTYNIYSEYKLPVSIKNNQLVFINNNYDTCYVQIPDNLKNKIKVPCTQQQYSLNTNNW